MNKRINLLLCIAVFAGIITSKAQTTFYLDGYGRALYTTDKLKGDLIDSDSLTNTTNKGVSGYTLFDLGLNLEKDKTFKANAILRARNQFGLFFGDGTRLEFRQIQLEGIIGKGVKYEIGDIDIKMTPFTVFNSEEMYNEFESDIFAQRRGILEYENFNSGNNWRLQGVKSYTNILFEKGIEKLGLYGFGVRTVPVNQVGTPDRVMAGFNATVTQSKNLKVGANYVSFLDLPISTATVEYTNRVGTLTLDYERDLNEKIGVFLNGEAGGSTYNLLRVNDNEEVSKEDYFYDAKIGVEVKKLQLKISTGFKNVGADFSSPGAQSRRYNTSAVNPIFSSIPDTAGSGSTVPRYATLYDRFTNEGTYNRNISNVLRTFSPQYNNINPYGDATPNRSGVTGNVSIGNEDSAYYASFTVNSLKEIRPDNNAAGELRSYTGLQGGILVNLDKVLDLDQDFSVKLGYQSESTTRSGADDIDLSTSLIDAGVSYEVLENFDLMAGYKLYTASGNEYISTLNEFNQFDALPTEVEFDFDEKILSIGGRFRFSENAALTVNYNMASYTNNKKDEDLDFTRENDSYETSQLFISYIMKF